LDIGCGNGWLRNILSESIHYIGLDYPATMALGYEGRPDILADASKLPIADVSVDTVAMLDVVEHLADPEQAVAEVSRVLRAGGKCFINVPFLYPLHDEPYDFQRWTGHGLRRLLSKHGFQMEKIIESTSPVETSALLMSIALAKGSLDSIQQKSPMIIVVPVILMLIPFVNIFGWFLGNLLPASKVMPCSYFVVIVKNRLVD